MNKKSLASLFILLIVCFKASAAQLYLVDAEVRRHGQLLGEPSLVVADGQKASLAVEGEYELAVVVDKVSEDEAQVSADVTIEGEQYRAETVVAVLGEPVRLAIDSVELVVSVKPKS